MSRSHVSSTAVAAVYERVVARDRVAPRVERLDLGHRVEAAALVALHVDVHAGLEPRPEARLRAPYALADGAHLAQAAGQERDDAVGLTQLLGAQDDRLVAVEGHPTIVRPRRPIHGMPWPPVARARRGSIAWCVHRCSTASERCGAQARAAGRPPGRDPAERLAEHQVTGEEDIGVAQAAQGDEVGGPGPDAGQVEQGGTGRRRVSGRREGEASGRDCPGEGDDRARPGARDADGPLQVRGVPCRQHLG